MGCVCIRWIGVLSVASVLCACFSPNGAGPTSSEPDSGTGDEPETRVDAGVELPGSGGTGGTFPLDAGVAPMPLPDEIALNQMQAQCLELDQPTCAGCHVHPIAGGFVLRPTFSPPPPPDLVFDSEDLEACGVFIDDGDGADAGR